MLKIAVAAVSLLDAEPYARAAAVRELDLDRAAITSVMDQVSVIGKAANPVKAAAHEKWTRLAGDLIAGLAPKADDVPAGLQPLLGVLDRTRDNMVDFVSWAIDPESGKEPRKPTTAGCFQPGSSTSPGRC